MPFWHVAVCFMLSLWQSSAVLHQLTVPCSCGIQSHSHANQAQTTALHFICIHGAIVRLVGFIFCRETVCCLQPCALCLVITKVFIIRVVFQLKGKTTQITSLSLTSLCWLAVWYKGVFREPVCSCFCPVKQFLSLEVKLSPVLHWPLQKQLHNLMPV